MRRLVSETDRVVKALLMGSLVALFVLIALFLNTGVAASFEGWAYSESTEHMSPLLTSTAKAVTHLGDVLPVTLVCLLFLVIPPLRRRYALPVIVTTVFAASLNALLKLAFMRPRPDILSLIIETDFSFPSGHAMINMALYGMVIILVWRSSQSRWKKITITAVLAVLVAAIGLTRVYLGVHYITDVIAGWCLGFAIALGVILAYDEIRRRSDNKDYQRSQRA
ncbi:MAG: phosphatase PAP2 family protein [Coriobacteriia bacterium]|nr:phosphatase PAP2 family protein [Coriobacteriia bacterium]